MSTTNDVHLTIPEEKELARIAADADWIISAEKAGAAARSSAELSVSTSRLWKIVFGVIALLFLSWLANAGLMVAVVNLSKEPRNLTYPSPEPEPNTLMYSTLAPARPNEEAIPHPHTQTGHLIL